MGRWGDEGRIWVRHWRNLPRRTRVVIVLTIVGECVLAFAVGYVLGRRQ